MSYAASFGNTTEEKLLKYGIRDQVAAWLKRFDSISVRDQNSADIVRNLTGLEPNIHLDPVLVYDFIGKCKEIPASIPDKDYLLLYGYSGRFRKSECNAIRSYAEQRNLRFFCIGGVQQCCDKFIDCDPFTVIAYFQHADCVITDTFHGTILSVITHQLFIPIVRRSGYGNMEKLSDLLERLALKDLVHHDLRNLVESQFKKIDYQLPDSIIKNERKKTALYLMETIF